MSANRLVDHQVKVEVTNHEGVIRLRFPGGQEIHWPVRDADVVPGEFFLTLSPTAQLPSREELARLVLKEILNSGD